MSTSSHSNSSAQYHVHADTDSPSSSDSEEMEHNKSRTTTHCFSPPLRVQHPSMHESWLVTPPPCFTLGGASPDGMTEHPLENLLIEHPSMSVYKRGRDSEADTAGESDECDVTATASLPANMVAGSRRPGSRQLATTSQSRAQFARRVQYAFTDINSRQVKAVQSSRKRKEAKNFARNQVHRSNKVQQYNSSNKSSKRKQHMARMHSGKNNDRKCQY